MTCERHDINPALVVNPGAIEQLACTCSEHTVTLHLTERQWRNLQDMRVAYESANAALQKAYKAEEEWGEPVEPRHYYARDDQAVEIADLLVDLIFPEEES